MLVPEIALTPQTIRRFAARFPGKVTVWHSELGDGERFDVWRRVRTDHPAAQVVVGSRSALFLPFPDLGLIVVDEEHEPQLQAGAHAALSCAHASPSRWAASVPAPVLLGSATPALETYYAARQGEIELLTLPKRILGQRDDGRQTADEAPQSFVVGPSVVSSTRPPSLPEVRVVDMRQELRAGNRSIFSRPLSSGLRHVLAAGPAGDPLSQPPRGRHLRPVPRLRSRGSCPRCAVPLTYHSAGRDCSSAITATGAIPCRPSAPIAGASASASSAPAPERRGGGQAGFPEARTLRWDRDVTGAKGSHEAILAVSSPTRPTS